jgi:hypothetical protein
LQAFGRSNPETLQSKNHRRCKIRLLLKGLQDVHGQLNSAEDAALLSGDEDAAWVCGFMAAGV